MILKTCVAVCRDHEDKHHQFNKHFTTTRDHPSKSFRAIISKAGLVIAPLWLEFCSKLSKFVWFQGPFDCYPKLSCQTHVVNFSQYVWTWKWSYHSLEPVFVFSNPLRFWGVCSRRQREIEAKSWVSDLSPGILGIFSVGKTAQFFGQVMTSTSRNFPGPIHDVQFVTPWFSKLFWLCLLINDPEIIGHERWGKWIMNLKVCK